MTMDLFPRSSDSDSAFDKDTLIDEMQEKIGGLLQCGQELAEARNEIAALQDRLANHEQQLVADLDDPVRVRLALDQTPQELVFPQQVLGLQEVDPQDPLGRHTHTHTRHKTLV